MDYSKTIELVGEIAGIGGLGIGVLLIIFRQILKLNIFPSLTKTQTFEILKLVIYLTWSVALLGIIIWCVSQYIISDKENIKVNKNSDKTFNQYINNNNINEVIAKDLLKDFYKLKPEDFELINYKDLVFKKNQDNKFVCLDYLNKNNKNQYVDCFIINDDKKSELSIHKQIYSSSYGFDKADIDSQAYFIIWSTGGSLNYLDISVYEYLKVGAVQEIWHNGEDLEIMGAWGMISDGEFFIEYGGGTYAKLSHANNKFSIVDASINYDTANAFNEKTDPDLFKTLFFSRKDAPFEFEFDGKKLQVAENKQDKDDINYPSGYYKVSAVNIKTGQFLCVRQRNLSDNSFLEIYSLSGKLAIKQSNPYLFLANIAGEAIVIVHDRYSSKYEIPIFISKN